LTKEQNRLVLMSRVWVSTNVCSMAQSYIEFSVPVDTIRYDRRVSLTWTRKLSI